MKSKKEYSVKEKLGLAIKNVRKAKKISQTNMSKAIIYNQSVISRMEQGYQEIHLNIFISALKHLGEKYIIDENLNNDINTLINKIYYCYEYQLFEKIGKLNNKTKAYQKANQNIIKYYDLLILELTSEYVKKNYKKCNELIKELDEVFMICEKRCQLLFLIIKIHLLSIGKYGSELNINNYEDVKKLDFNDGLVLYLKGLLYLKTFNYSKSIKNLSNAQVIFKDKNNFYRLIRCDIYLNRILLYEENYLYVKEKIFKIFSKKIKLNEIDYNRLLFQLCYSLYHLKEYKKCLSYLKKIKIYVGDNSKMFSNYLKIICEYKIFNDKPIIEKEIIFNNYLVYLYFNEEMDENSSLIIEEYIEPTLERNYYKKEYYYYCIKQLDYYWNNRQYKKYKCLSDKIHKIMHIL